MKRVGLCRMAVAFAAPLFCACSVVLDFEALGRGQEDSDEDTVTRQCTLAADCDDGIDCTQDQCGENGSCLESLPDDDACGHLEMCKRGQGCIPTGDECEVPADCDDGIACTKERCDLGMCFHVPKDEVCDASDPCIIDDTCDPQQGCLSGSTMVCEQVMPGVDLTCRQVVCNSTNGSCDLVVLSGGADDDSDSALDKACGGDDCDDMDATKRPAAAEVCDFKDNDCDGLTDIDGSFAPLELDTGDDGSLRRPGVATDGEHLVVAWQRGSGAEGDIRVIFLSAAGQPVTGQASLAVLLGSDKGLSMPTLASASGKVLLAFAQGQDSDTRLEVVGLRADLTGSSIAIESPNLEVESGRPILDLALAEDPVREGGSEFAVLYCALAEDGQQEVLAATPFDMESTGPALLSRGELGEVELELLRLAPHRFVAAMAMRDPSTDSTEIWTADLLSEELEPTQGTVPLLLSTATSGLADTSSSPRAALVGSRVLVSWSDVAKASGGFFVEPDSDVRAAFLDEPSTLVGLVNDSGVNQRPWGAVALGSGLGLLFAQTTAAGALLDFRLFDSDMNAVGQQAGRIAHVPRGALQASRLLETSEGLAVAWVQSVASQDALRWLAFSACEIP